MNNQVSQIINKAINPNRRLNCLTYPVHERAQNCLSKTNCDFYMYRGHPGIKDWNFKYGYLPKNHFLLNPNLGPQQLPKDITFDFILCQNKQAHYAVSYELSQRLGIPIVHLEHCLPYPGTPQGVIKQFKEMRAAETVFISHYNREAWGYSEDEATVIYHAVDTDLFKPDPTKKKINRVMVCANDYINRDAVLGFSLFKKVCEGLDVRIIGDTVGLSVATPSVEKLVEEYQTSTVFFNSAHISPIPTVVLEAMSCGLPVVSIRASDIPHFVHHGKNGLLGNNEYELRKHLKDLLNDEAMRIELGANARKTILDMCNMDRFTNEWNQVFNRVSKD